MSGYFKRLTVRTQGELIENARYLHQHRHSIRPYPGIYPPLKVSKLQ